MTELNISNPEPGIYQGVSFGDYKDIDAVNSSSLKNMVISALNYKSKMDAEDKTTKSMDIGRLGHMAILEPERWNNDYVVYDGRRAGKKWEAYKEENDGKEICIPSEHDRVVGMLASAYGHKTARKILSECKREVTVIFVEQSTGILCKSRIDCFDEALRYYSDLKTAKDVDPYNFYWQSRRLLYHFQYAFYRIAIHSLFGVWVDTKCIAVQNHEPFDTVVYNVPTDDIDKGMKLVIECLQKLRECKKSGNWPGISEEEIELECPVQAIDEDDDEITL